MRKLSAQPAQVMREVGVPPNAVKTSMQLEDTNILHSNVAALTETLEC